MHADVQAHRYALTSGRYVGAALEDDEDEPFEERFPALRKRLVEQLAKNKELGGRVERLLGEVTDG